jgi:dihydroflavonol-4-reductase
MTEDATTRKKAVVTGATGCVGRNLVDVLLAEGWEIIVLHRKSSNLSKLDGCQVDFAEADLHNIDSVRSSIPENLDAVFHVAGSVSHWSRESEQQYRDNVLVTRNLVKVCLEKNTNRFIFTSTGATVRYRHLERDQLESIKESYIYTKRLSEFEVLDGVEKGLDAVILNPIIVVGKYDYNNYSQIFDFIKNSPLPMLVFPGSISFCHAEDIVNAHLKAFYSGKKGESYILAGPYATWLDFFQRAANILGSSEPKRATPLPVIKFIAVVLDLLSHITRKEPLITPELVSLVDEINFPEEEKQKSFNDLGFESRSIDEMIQDCHQWMQKEKMI